MEALLLMLNSIAVIIVVYMGLQDERRAQGAPRRCLFRMTEGGKAADRSAAERERQERLARSRVL